MIHTSYSIHIHLSGAVQEGTALNLAPPPPARTTSQVCVICCMSFIANLLLDCCLLFYVLTSSHLFSPIFSVADSAATSTDFKIELKNAVVVIDPPSGVVGPQESFTVTITCKGGKIPQRIRYVYVYVYVYVLNPLILCLYVKTLIKPTYSI
jgi:hypothetical protein